MLTDGAVSNDDQVIALVRSNSANARVFSIGVGNWASRYFPELDYIIFLYC